MAFNAKNLHYEKQEPAFLRRLKGNYDAADGRNNVQIARPKKARLKTGDDDEDDPVILNEQGDVVGKAEFQDMQKDDFVVAPEANPHTVSPNNVLGSQTGADSRDAQAIAEVRGPKKRKQARAIGGDDSDGDPAPLHNEDHSVEKDQRLITSPKTSRKILEETAKATKIKRKAKKIKLSFEEPE